MREFNSSGVNVVGSVEGTFLASSTFWKIFGILGALYVLDAWLKDALGVGLFPLLILSCCIGCAVLFVRSIPRRRAR